MQRQAILETIQRHLHETHDATPQAKLSELVGRIARELRQEKPDTSTVVSIIPIEQIAAFVDGDLDHDRIEAVNRSVLVDNSVLAELVAAVRAVQTPIESLPPVAETLTERLLAMYPMETVSSKDIARMMHEPEAESRRARLRWAIPAIAGMVGLAWFALARPDRTETITGERQDLSTAMASKFAASNDSKPVERLASEDAEVSSAIQAIAPEPPIESSLVAGSPDQSRKKPESESSGEALTPPSTPMPTSDVKPKPSSKTVSPATVTEVESSEDVDSASRSLANNAPPQWESLQMTTVTGLLGRVTNKGIPNAPDPMLVYARVGQDETLSLDSPVRLRTLAYCNAVATMNVEGRGTGRILIAENTFVAAGSGNQRTSIMLDVVEGAVAIEGAAKGAVVRLQNGPTSIGKLVMGNPSRAILYAVAGGVELRLQNVQLFVDNERVGGDGVRLTAAGASAVAIPPSMTPNWLSSPPATIERSMLMQIGESTDLAESLGTQIKRLSASSRLNDSQVTELSRLARMRVSLAGGRLFALASDPIEIVRRTTIEAIALLPKDDPKHQTVWASIEKQIQDPSQRGQMDVWMQLIRTGGQPTPEQLAAMLNSLTSESASVRGLGDVMLRRYVSAPPAFDPNGSPKHLQATIMAYQKLLDQQ